MWFVLKAIFWFGVVLLFLPEAALHNFDKKSENPVDAAAITSSISARDAVVRISHICSEQPQVCERAADVLSTLELDTEKGARLALEILLRAVDDKVQKKPSN